MTWAAMVQAWERRYEAGEIRFDPRLVAMRVVPVPEGAIGQFRVILNAGRKDRPAKAA